jgi:hypothetical protein
MLNQKSKKYYVELGKESYPLPNDYMQVLAVFTSKKRRIPLNKEDDRTSVYTPNMKELLIPDVWLGHNLYMVYVASHDPMKLELNYTFNSDTNSIDVTIKEDSDLWLPDTFNRAIMHYVSYLSFVTINDTPNVGHHLHLNDYNNELNNLDILGYRPNETIINNNFTWKGFR